MWFASKVAGALTDLFRAFLLLLQGYGGSQPQSPPSSSRDQGGERVFSAQGAQEWQPQPPHQTLPPPQQASQQNGYGSQAGKPTGQPQGSQVRFASDMCHVWLCALTHTILPSLS